MRNGKTFAMFFNASPRKSWNTAKMLEAAAYALDSFAFGIAAVAIGYLTAKQ